jgi:hypothetical protein
MESTMLITYQFEPDFRRKCDTLIAHVSPENSLPFRVVMSGVKRRDKGFDGALMTRIRRETVRMMQGQPSELVEVDGEWHCPMGM